MLSLCAEFMISEVYAAARTGRQQYRGCRFLTFVVYLDEQEGLIDGEAYTAVIGFRVRAADIIKIRAKFYPLYNEILDQEIRGPHRSEDIHVHRMPDLHGSNFLREFSPDTKTKVLDALVETISEFDCDFLRIGYFNRSFPPGCGTKDKIQIINLATLGVSFAIRDKPDENHLLVSEFDKESLRKTLDSVFSNLSINFATRPENVSFDLMHFVGHYRGTKSELGCQIADVVNYCCLKYSSETKSHTNALLSSYYKKLAHRFIVNQVIWINNREHTRQFTQSNPIANATSRYDTDPITGIYRIIPNDLALQTEDLEVIAPNFRK